MRNCKGDQSDDWHKHRDLSYYVSVENTEWRCMTKHSGKTVFNNLNAQMWGQSNCNGKNFRGGPILFLFSLYYISCFSAGCSFKQGQRTVYVQGIHVSQMFTQFITSFFCSWLCMMSKRGDMPNMVMFCVWGAACFRQRMNWWGGIRRRWRLRRWWRRRSSSSSNSCSWNKHILQ